MSHYDEESSTFFESLKNREAEAVTFFITKYTPILTGFASKHRFAPHEIEDLTQQTWEIFFNKLITFEHRSKLSSFLIGILLNKCREEKRKLSRITLIENTSDDIFFREDGHWKEQRNNPEKLTENYQSIERLERILPQLPEMQQKVLFLKLVEERSTTEVCEILQLSENNMNVILYRAKMNIRHLLES